MTPPILQLVEYWKEYEKECAAASNASLRKLPHFGGFVDWLERKVK